MPLIIEEGECYEKYRSIYARQTKAGEIISTITADGLETTNEAKKGDFIVRNQTTAKESYILKPEKFKERYVLAEEEEGAFKKYRPIGKILALEMTKKRMEQLNWKDEIHFEAPWGSPMILKTTDYLACPLDLSEVYRIARKEFFETYRLKDK